MTRQATRRGKQKQQADDLPNSQRELDDATSHRCKEALSSSPSDPRALRSGEALRSAFLGLLETKPFDQIMIKEITDAAGIHRATFSRHYPTREALLDDIAAEQIDSLVAMTLPIMDSLDSEAGTRSMFAYVSEHRKLWTALLTGGAADTMRNRMLRISRALATERTSAESWLPTALAVNCSVALIFETLAWWLTDPSELDVTKAASLLHRLLWSAGHPLVNQKPLTGGSAIEPYPA